MSNQSDIDKRVEDTIKSIDEIRRIGGYASDLDWALNEIEFYIDQLKACRLFSQALGEIINENISGDAAVREIERRTKEACKKAIKRWPNQFIMSGEILVDEALQAIDSAKLEDRQ